MVDSSPVELVCSLFYGLPNWRKRLAVFAAYSDESASGNTDGVFLVGGYLARAGLWEEFTERWAVEVLNTYPAIPYLHITEIKRKSWQAKYGLSVQDADRKVRAATELIGSYGHRLSGIVAHTHTNYIYEAGAWLRSKRTRRGMGEIEPDYLCFLGFAGTILMRLHEQFGQEAERVDFFISRKNKVTGQIMDRLIPGMRRVLPPYWGRLLGEIIPLEMNDRAPLQAADCLCWHRMKHHDGGQVEDDFYDHFANLSRTSQEVICWNRETIFKMAANAVKFFGPKESPTPPARISESN